MVRPLLDVSRSAPDPHATGARSVALDAVGSLAEASAALCTFSLPFRNSIAVGSDRLGTVVLAPVLLYPSVSRSMNRDSSRAGWRSSPSESSHCGRQRSGPDVCSATELALT